MFKRFIWIAIALSVATTCPVYAASFQTEVTNNIQVGDISIRLDEYELDEAGKEIPYENDKTVIPGQEVDKIVRITNQANEAWIRAKLEYQMDDGMKGLSDACVTLSSDDWIKCGEYYYYKKPVPRDTGVDFINRVEVPYQWDESNSEKGFSVIVTADAVQTANFTPDFTGNDPWFGTLVETCVHTTFTKPQDINTQNFTVTFKNRSEGFVRIGDDFFSNWGQLMPGDTVSDKVQLKNTYGRSVTIYFQTETIASDELLKAIHLEIRNKDKIIYSGTMDGAVKDGVELAYLRRGDTAELTYTLSVPAELNNKYAMMATKTKWIFSAVVKPASGVGIDTSSGGGPTGGSDTIQPNPEPTITNQTIQEIIETTGEIIKKIPKLGDDNLVLYSLLAMIASSAGIAILVWTEKKGEKKKDEKQEIH